jgi:LmbE family N-acetylglucosaminyl deacetylase
MERRKFLRRSLTGGAAAGMAAAQTRTGRSADLPTQYTPSAHAIPHSGYSPFTTPDYFTFADDLTIERSSPGKPHQGKVLAAVQAHSDDIPLFASGTVAKLIDEGYTGYLIRVSNDEAAGRTLGYGVVQNEADIQECGKAMGCKKVFSFYYRNHRMDDNAIIEIRARLIFLFRFLQVTTVFAMDPYDHYDENPDHIVVGKAVEGACWMSGASKDYAEHYKAGLKPAHIRDKYYHARSPQGHNLVNRIVDISPYIDRKVRTNMANTGKGPAGLFGARLRQQLARQGKKLPLLGDNDDTANFAYVKHFLMDDFRVLGRQFNVEYAEAFRYIGPPPVYADNIMKYALANAVPL